jgi:hypothetical protein
MSVSSIHPSQALVLWRLVAAVVGIAACVLMSTAVSVSGMGFRLFSDAAHTSIYADDSAPGTLTVYVVHESFAEGATGSIFRIRGSAGFTGVWLSESSPFGTVGTSTDGIAMLYPECLFGSAQVLQVNYMLFGTSDECATLQVVNHPSQPEGIIEIPTCDDLILAFGGTLTINPTQACALKTESTSWGKIKALYR